MARDLERLPANGKLGVGEPGGAVPRHDADGRLERRGPGPGRLQVVLRGWHRAGGEVCIMFFLVSCIFSSVGVFRYRCSVFCQVPFFSCRCSVFFPSVSVFRLLFCFVVFFSWLCSVVPGIVPTVVCFFLFFMPRVGQGRGGSKIKLYAFGRGWLL